MLELFVGSIWTWIGAAVALLAIAIHLFFTWGLDVFRSQGVPESRASWFTRTFGPMWMSFHQYDHLIHQTAGKPNKVFGMYSGRTPHFFIRDPDLAKEIMIKEFANFPVRFPAGGFRQNGEQEFLNSMLITSEGEEWKNQRVTMTPTFTTGKIKLMIPEMGKGSKTMVDNVRNMLKSSDQVDLLPALQDMSVDLVGRIFFGLEGERNPEFVHHSIRIIRREMTLNSLITLFFPSIAKRFGLSTWPKDSIRYLAEVAEEAIRIRKNDPVAKKRVDYLNILLNAELMDDDSNSSLCPISNNINGILPTRKVLDQKSLLAQCILFIFAGTEVIATAVQMVLYLLALHPDALRRVQEEIDAIFQQREDEIDYEALKECKYLDMVIDETFRLYNPAERTMRSPQADITVDGVTFPKGCFITFPIHLLHHDPEFHPEPEEFRPERFSAENKGKMNQFTYMPFGMGPRNCIANRFALIETKVVVTHFLRNFSVDTCQKTKAPENLQFRTSFGGVLQPHEIVLKVSER